ncbi:MAG: prepilin-type N-terminal cleavage/methylation domain-containing protein [Desulfomonilaceae bacterium]|nr:prepilin-type N-terminal cleavage/methylation domain-containing protein [Desulfomonilaceae bacterium]
MITSRSLLRSQEGFTLVEVMTAVLILSIGLLGVGTLVISSMRAESYNSYVRQAEYLASSKLEELRADTVGGDLTTNSPTGEGKYPLPDGTEEDVPGNAQVYVRHTTIGTYDNNMALVRVVVGWPYESTMCHKDSIEGCTYKFRMNATILQR